MTHNEDVRVGHGGEGLVLGWRLGMMVWYEGEGGAWGCDIRVRLWHEDEGGAWGWDWGMRVFRNHKYLIKKIFALIKEKAFKYYMEKCMNDTQESDYYLKLRTYKTFKQLFKQEIYLSEIKDYRSIITLASEAYMMCII